MFVDVLGDVLVDVLMDVSVDVLVDVLVDGLGVLVDRGRLDAVVAEAHQMS